MPLCPSLDYSPRYRPPDKILVRANFWSGRFCLANVAVTAHLRTLRSSPQWSHVGDTKSHVWLQLNGQWRQTTMTIGFHPLRLAWCRERLNLEAVRVLGCHTRCFPSLNSFRHLVKSLLGPLGKDLDLLDAVLHPFFVFVDRYLECWTGQEHRLCQLTHPLLVMPSVMHLFAI